MFLLKRNLNLASPNILAPLRGYPTTSIMELNIKVTQVTGEEWWLTMVATSFRKSDYKLSPGTAVKGLNQEIQAAGKLRNKGKRLSAKADLKTELCNPRQNTGSHPSNGQASCFRTASQLVCPSSTPHLRGTALTLWRQSFSSFLQKFKQIWAHTVFTEYLLPFTVYL